MYEQGLVGLLCQLEQLAGLPAPLFQRLYLKPCLKLVAYLQELPDLEGDLSSYEAGYSLTALRCRLEKVVAGLRLASREIPSRSLQDHSLCSQDSMRYQIFIALFMYNLPQILMGYEIRYKKKGMQDAQIWNPVLHSSLTPQTVYWVESKINTDTNIALLLLPRFFEAVAIEWVLNQHTDQLYQSVVDPLRVDHLSPVIGQIYPGRQLNSDTHKTGKTFKTISTSNQEQHTNTGVNFLQWLQKSIEDGSLPINKKGAMILKQEGHYALISPKIFQYYSQHIKQDYIDVQKSFLKLKKHRINQHQKPISAFHRVETNNHIHQCILVPDQCINTTDRQEETDDKRDDNLIREFLSWALKQKETTSKNQAYKLCFTLKDSTAFVYPQLFDEYVKTHSLPMSGQSLSHKMIQKGLHDKSTGGSDFAKLNTGSKTVRYLKIYNQNIHKLLNT